MTYSRNLFPRLIQTVILFLFLLTSCKNRPVVYAEFDNFPEQDKIVLKTAVKELHVVKYEPVLSFGKPELGRIKSHKEYIFDVSGKIIEINLRNPGLQNLLFRAIYTYNEDGDLAKAEWYNETGRVKDHSTYTRDGENFTETRYFSDGGLA